MAKSANTSASAVIRVTISSQSARMLGELATKGIYGRNAAEVAARFVDEALRKFAEAPALQIPGVQDNRGGD